jgi:DNA-binding response OmpR family regulator
MRIIIVSGVVNKDEIDHLLGIGADTFLQKPFSIDELIEKITVLLKI